jgi:hypothetical protein
MNSSDCFEFSSGEKPLEVEVRRSLGEPVRAPAADMFVSGSDVDAGLGSLLLVLMAS